MNCDYFADHAERMLAREPIEWDGPKAFVTFNPLGAILAVMPWNFPFWQVFRFAAPSLMAGNTAVLKHASNVPGCALAIEDVFREAGFPANVFSTVLIPSRDVDALIANPAIAAVTLTGSVEAGRSVATAAGRNLKKCVLELGGSDAYLILEDADIERAVDRVDGRSHGQRRAELHRRQTLHCRLSFERGFREGLHGQDACHPDGRSERPRHEAWPARQRRSP